jgi:subtilase family serine protease
MYQLKNVRAEILANQIRTLAQENAYLKNVATNLAISSTPSPPPSIRPFYTFMTPSEIKKMASSVASANTLNNSIPNIPPISYSGSQLIDLYSVPSVSPTGKTRKIIVAIIVAFHYGYLLSDLNTYWKSPVNFGPNATPPNVIVHNLTGSNSSSKSTNSGWDQEECLDVQMICTIAPNAEIHVVEAKSDSAIDLNAAIQFALSSNVNADIISMSWGGNDDSTNIPYNSIFNTSRNVCFCAASGDANATTWPSVLSNCVSVGGTTLAWTPTPNAPAARTEYTWPNAGCGYSATISTPAYQSVVNTTKNRCTPDISLIANPQTGMYVLYAGQWYGFGGTSVSTPIFAGMLALANQQRLNAGKPLLTTIYNQSGSNSYNLQSKLYSIINSPSYSQVFYDIITGLDNGSTSTNTAATYSAGTKYDIATGLGSPNANVMIQYLNSF